MGVMLWKPLCLTALRPPASSKRPESSAAVVKTVVTATDAGRKDLATKTDLAQLESRLEAKFSALEIKFAGLEAKFAALETRFAAAINKMVLSQLAVAGLLFAALKLF